MTTTERQVTHAPHGHILTNANVWSRDGRRIVYDVRSDPAGNVFDGDRIETVDVETGEVRVLYQSTRGAKCGVATYSPTADRVVFILGPEDPTPDFAYGPARRRGVMVDEDRPGELLPLDARDLVPPFTPGALRGGSHVHVFSPDGSRVSFTYEDNVLDRSPGERNQRNVGVSLLGHAVRVPPTHPRNHDGEAFTVLATRTTDNPKPGTDDISRAYEDAWVGTHGYLRPDGTRQRWAIAFLGDVESEKGYSLAEVFITDLPDDLTVPGDGPLEGTESTRPRPPRGTLQRRLTYTAGRKYPGVWSPRHWVRSSPDGSRIAFLLRDDDGIVQLWTVSPNGGPPTQLTRSQRSIGSAFTWSPDGRRIAHVIGNSVCVSDANTGETVRLTVALHIDANTGETVRLSVAFIDLPTDTAPRWEACVFSPDGSRIAYVRPIPTGSAVYNQVFVCDVPQ